MRSFFVNLCFIICCSAVCFSQKDPLLSKDKKEQLKWVKNKMEKMTVEEKIGQLFMVAAYSNKGEEHTKNLKKLILDYKVGGFIFMKGTPKKQVDLNNQLQAISKLPLLMGFDGEWGLDMRLKNTYRFPWNMTLGAIKDNDKIELLGKRLGEHCKRVGIHVNFAPVLDINTNPKNPIIGNRSYGEDKGNVTAKASAFVKGMQSVGVLANGKHFPGHGDTSQDSHKTLPLVEFSKDRINRVELYPYKKLFREGLASVMVGHLNIPSLEPTPKLPTSLSKSVVTGLLKNKLSYNGLIFTDGMGMAGASDFGTPASINLKAFMAGNDILLIPSHISKTVELFKQALEDGQLTIQRLDYSVEKILKAKYLVGLHKYNSISKKNLIKDLNTTQDELLHRDLVEASITLLKNEPQLVPIKNLDESRIAYVKLGNADSEPFENMLANYTKITKVSKTNLAKLKDFNLVIVGYHQSNKNPWKSYKMSSNDLKILNNIASKHKTIFNVFTSPYALLQLKSFKAIESVVVSYQNSVLAQELTAQALFGATSIRGELPVSIQDYFSVGHGLKTSTLDRLQYTIPEAEQMSSDSLNKVNLLAKRILDQGMAPGLQILVARHGKVVYNKSFGYQTTKKKQPVLKSDLYDVASLTKILSTLPVVMKATEDRKLSINSTFGELDPSYVGTNKDTLKIKEVLSHYGRLIPWIPFYKRTQNRKGDNLPEYYSTKRHKKYQIQVAKDLYLSNQWTDSITHIIKTIKQRPFLRYKYSDLGYYFLKNVLEDKYKKPLNILADDMFYKSLGMNSTTYLPLDKYDETKIVPSENDNYFRHQELRGYVHDMGAAMQNGVGGHAGLFSNANDIAKLMQMYLQGGYYGGNKFLKPRTINTFNKRYFAHAKNRRGLGFDKPQINPKEKSTCGCVSDKSFGHSGFTGTYTWADPVSGIIYVFLSNRTYPTMKNKKLVRSGIRTLIQKTIQCAILD